MSSPPEITTTTMPPSNPPPETVPTPSYPMPTSSYIYFSCNYLATLSGILKFICLVCVKFFYFQYGLNSAFDTNITVGVDRFIYRSNVYNQLNLGDSHIFQNCINSFVHFDLSFIRHASV